jgi:hypothetical protein
MTLFINGLYTVSLETILILKEWILNKRSGNDAIALLNRHYITFIDLPNPKDTNLVDRIMNVFGVCYYEFNSRMDNPITSAGNHPWMLVISDDAHMMAFMMVLLNRELHQSSKMIKMKPKHFVNILKTEVNCPTSYIKVMT